ncbi:uncharacterized protein isoform X2 [Leptinotarsa decemlineata]|uniref:uncharacterized protein isoform X2 n=1 Tax=Leptinotarsa decemlineata TaxID=7539 RepID=UPI003D305391
MRHIPGFGILLFFLIEGSASQEFNITPITTSSGLYYEKIGDVLLSNSNWEFVTSVDYGGYLLFYQYLQNQAEKLHGFCQEYQSKYCEERYEIIRASMDSIASTDEILANYLGTEAKRRVKRFWFEAFKIAAPYLLKPLGEGFSKLISGGNIDKRRLQEYESQISQLRQGQEDIINELGAQRTMFQLDSEKKGNQINFLKRTQEGIQNELKILKNTVGQNFEEHEKKIKDLNDMLSETNRKLKQQEDRQRQLISDVEHIKNDVENIYDNLDSIEKEISINRNDINATKIETKLNTISINFNFLLSRFEAEQKTLLDVVQNANRGFLDPYIITPLHLIEMLRIIQPMLPEDSRLPFHPTFENARTLYNIIKPTIFLHNNKILFILQIPLVHTKSFEIFKMTSFPMQVARDKYVYVSPKKEYLLVNDKQTHLLEYVLTSAANFREFCQNLGRGMYICDHIQQTNGPSSNLECEVQLFSNKKELSGSCNTKVMKLKKPVFIKLLEYGAWIYVAPYNENLVISCDGGSRKNVNLKGVGFLNLSKDCTAQTSEFSLRYTSGSKPVDVSGSYSPVMKLTDYIDTSRIEALDAESFDNHKQVILPFELGELDTASVGIRDIKSLNDGTDYTTVIYVVALVIVVMIGIVLFRKSISQLCFRRKCTQRENQDIPSRYQYSTAPNNEIVTKQFP